MRIDRIRLAAIVFAGVTVAVGAGFMATGRWAIGGFFVAIGGGNGIWTGYRIWRDKRIQQDAGDPRRTIGLGFLGAGVAGLAGGLALVVAGSGVQHIYGFIIMFGGVLSVATAIRGWPEGDKRDEGGGGDSG
jgi:hypothetical protein